MDLTCGGILLLAVSLAVSAICPALDAVDFAAEVTSLAASFATLAELDTASLAAALAALAVEAADFRAALAVFEALEAADFATVFAAGLDFAAGLAAVFAALEAGFGAAFFAAAFVAAGLGAAVLEAGFFAAGFLAAAFFAVGFFVMSVSSEPWLTILLNFLKKSAAIFFAVESMSREPIWASFPPT